MSRRSDALAFIKELYYITHIDNLPSILERGILSYERVINENIRYTPIYDEQIVSKRKEIKAPNDKSLWSFANLYFKAQNAMLFRVICEKKLDEIVVLGIRKDVLKLPDVYITTGNAASLNSKILPASQLGQVKREIMEILKMNYWREEDGSKRRTMAECLIPNYVPPEYIQAIYCAGYDVMYKVDAITNYRIPSIFEPSIFFQPNDKYQITENLYIVNGDMFFSRMQTLTISVNTVGIMGKGLASRAKHFFPDLYVKYQDLCRKRILQMGKPYLYKRETSFDYQIADEPQTLQNANSETWFLLFPTKKHWRDRADIHGIERGLQWLQDNYKKLGIKSLATPALGCGLGGLDWEKVGPLLCRYLSEFDISVHIYLPMEKKIPKEQISKKFLLGKD